MDHPEDCEVCGTVSHGTLRGEDLIPRFIEVLSELLEASAAEEGADAPDRMRRFGQVEAFIGEIERRMSRPGYFDSEDASQDVEWLFDTLDEYAPDGHWFGAHPGDGADFGFWPSEDE